MLNRIEDTALKHFAFLPECVGFAPKENNGVTLINCGLGSSMFNIAFGGLQSPKQNWPHDIQNVIQEFKGQPFAWWVPHSVYQAELGSELENMGLKIETTEHAMICELDSFHDTQQQTEVQFIRVKNKEKLQDFVSILEPYDPTAKTFYEKLTPSMLNQNENLFVGYYQKKPVVIGILFLNQDTAGIFSVLTSETERGKGYGSDLMKHLMSFAKDSGLKYASLSASSDSGYRIYERLGFKRIGQFECFEYSIITSCIFYNDVHKKICS